KYGGTGLGLTISNRLLELMSSKLELESKPGEGSTFHFNIEIPFQEEETVARYGVNPSSIPVNEKILKGDYTILIAEDNPVNLLLSKTLVRRYIPEAHIYEASNGLEAVLLFSEVRPDLILMDVQMPEMSGLKSTLKIRELEGG